MTYPLPDTQTPIRLSTRPRVGRAWARPCVPIDESRPVCVSLSPRVRRRVARPRWRMRCDGERSVVDASSRRARAAVRRRRGRDRDAGKKHLRLAIASSDGGDDGGRDDGDDDAVDDAKAVRDGDAGARCDDVDAGERERGEGEDAGEV